MSIHPSRSRLLPVMLAAAGLLVGCGAAASTSDEPGASAGGDAPSVDAAATVSVVDNTFEPGTVAVTAGETVVWTWEGNAPHDVSGDGFASDVRRAGTFTHTFERPGTYEYVCTLHAGMTGVVEVADA
ncbi:plastocyanin/azurin family copper-binding protein [Egicoccus sp. AB-alg2]|uniref:cupredoxin domain-containing protein n=1 Tax=Egicoccus sp. AB-alg2 TaxID=3242693 RepID=UPI00359CE6AD